MPGHVGSPASTLQARSAEIQRELIRNGLELLRKRLHLNPRPGSLCPGFQPERGVGEQMCGAARSNGGKHAQQQFFNRAGKEFCISPASLLQGCLLSIYFCSSYLLNNCGSCSKSCSFSAPYCDFSLILSHPRTPQSHISSLLLPYFLQYVISLS